MGVDYGSSVMEKRPHNVIRAEKVAIRAPIFISSNGNAALAAPSIQDLISRFQTNASAAAPSQITTKFTLKTFQIMEPVFITCRYVVRVYEHKFELVLDIGSKTEHRSHKRPKNK